jgi:hypothetical protein
VGGVPGAGKQSGVEQEQGGRANRSDDPTFEVKPADQIERPGLFAQFENSGTAWKNEKIELLPGNFGKGTIRMQGEFGPAGDQ